MAKPIDFKLSPIDQAMLGMKSFSEALAGTHTNLEKHHGKPMSIKNDGTPPVIVITGPTGKVTYVPEHLKKPNPDADVMEVFSNEVMEVVGNRLRIRIDLFPISTSEVDLMVGLFDSKTGATLDSQMRRLKVLLAPSSDGGVKVGITPA